MTTARDGLQQFLDESTRDISCLKILEAGCGSRSNIRFGDCVHWVGIDISAAQLDRNVGLSEKIMDDVQVHEFEPSTFDMVVCWDVLEHLKDPEAALVRFAAATKPGGLIVLKIPNLHSLKGQLTKLLPHGFHVKWYQYIHGRQFTNRVDGGPFRTYLRRSIAPKALRKFAAHAQLDVPFEGYYDMSSAPWLKRKKPALYAYKAATFAATVASFGTLKESEYIIVLRKK